jgi:glutamate-1-semialdehyde 2,1-aminomutase
MKIIFNKIWQEATKIIPGGNMLYSKRAEMFLPGAWPAYFVKSKDCYLWDKNKKKYVDMIFAVGTNVLGYSNKSVNKAVKKAIDAGVMTTLNSYEEVLLAKKLLKLNQWADMVKFARSGGEANAISIRIARAYSNKKQNVAMCGYHGWHDWYLSSNLKNNSNLNSYLSKNVKIAGVNRKLKNTTFLFKYNDLVELERLLNKKKIGIIKMEVERSIKPKKNFLQNVRKLANKYKAVLIFDECTSGFRQTLGGIYKDYRVTPDIITYGKALGNGYAITAIVGKKKFMQACQDTFISSTFWSERVGFAAALETIKLMEKKNTHKIIKKTGKYIKLYWKKLSKKNNINIIVSGIDSIPQFSFEKENQKNKTFLTQEMLKKGYLASNIVYVSTVHTRKILNKYFLELDLIFKRISLNKNTLDGKIAHTEFKRLN